jgi:hypothetical protein
MHDLVDSHQAHELVCVQEVQDDDEMAQHCGELDPVSDDDQNSLEQVGGLVEDELTNAHLFVDGHQPH